MKLRQCVFVCKDLESSREELCDILGIEVAYRDPGVAKWGLVNVVCPTGHDFLEIVTPFQHGTSAGRYIERRKGDGGYMVILQVPDAAAERKRVTALGVRAVAQKDLPEYQYTHFHPSDTAGVLLSLDTTFAPHGRRSGAVVAAGREGLAEACALGRHQRPGRRRDPARRSGQGRGLLVEDPEPSGRGRHHPARRLADPLRADRRRTRTRRVGLRREGRRPRARAGGGGEARQEARRRLRSRSAAAASTWCDGLTPRQTRRAARRGTAGRRG